MGLEGRNKLVALKRWENQRAKYLRYIASTEHDQEARAIICGFLAGDGNLNESVRQGVTHSCVGFYPDDDYILATYIDCMKRVFGVTPTVRALKSYYSVRTHLQTVLEYLRSLGQFGVHNWRVPEFVKESRSLTKLWLRAFYAADGGVRPKYIRLQTVNELGMKDVSQMLQRIGVHHNSYVHHPRNTRHSTVHIIIIGTWKAKEFFAKEIGFFHERKNVALERYLYEAT
jgi:intein/homing endonuclease